MRFGTGEQGCRAPQTTGVFLGSAAHLYPAWLDLLWWPIAHLGYFHEEIVVRRKWLDEQNYADLLALC